MLPTVRPDEPDELTVRSDGYVTRRLSTGRIRAFETRELGDVRLERGGSLLLRIRGVEAGECVQVTVRERDTWKFGTRVRRRTGEGDLRIDGLSAATYDIEVACGSRLPWQVRESAFGEGEVRLREAVLQPGFAILGRVVGAAGEPIADALVRMLDEGVPHRHRDVPPFTTTNAAGEFTLSGLRRGTHLVSVERHGLSPFRISVVAPALHVELRPKTAPSMEGIVVDEAGLPLPDSQVRASFPDPEWGTLRTRVFRTASGVGGRFRLDGLPPGKLVLEATAPHGGSAVLVPESLRRGEDRKGVEIRVSPTLAVRGRVVDTRELPIAGAIVRLVDRDPRDPPGRYRTLFALDPARGRRGPHATSGADGGFAMRAAAGRSWWIRASGTGFRASAWSRVSSAGGELRIVLEPAAVLRGIARVSGALAADHHVVLLPPGEREGPPLRFTRTGEDGAYAFEDVPPGRYDLLLRDGEGVLQATREVEVLPGAGQVVDLP